MVYLGGECREIVHQKKSAFWAVVWRANYCLCRLSDFSPWGDCKSVGLNLVALNNRRCENDSRLFQ